MIYGISGRVTIGPLLERAGPWRNCGSVGEPGSPAQKQSGMRFPALPPVRQIPSRGRPDRDRPDSGRICVENGTFCEAMTRALNMGEATP